MQFSRRSLLVLAGSTVATAGCLSNDLPLFQVDVYNATDSTVTAAVTVVRDDTEETVQDDTVSVPGTDGNRRKTVAENFEKGIYYAATVSVGDRSAGKLFQADKEGPRKLTFEIDEDGIMPEFG